MKALMIGALCVSLLGPTAARAASTGTGTASPIPAMRKALAGATRYQLALSQGAIADVPPTQSTATVLGTGKAAQVYLAIVFTAKGKTIRAQEYVAGAKVCRRLGTTGRFSCAHSPSEAAKVTQGLDPTALLIRPGVAVTFAAVPRKIVGDHKCDGYGVVSRFNTGETSTSLLYVAHGSSLPCELDGTIRLTLSETDRNGTRAKVQTAPLRIVWSHFGDPSLTIPAIPTR
jgi:hypothetical protein